MIMNERSMVEELLNRPPYDGSEECDNLFIEALRDELVFHKGGKTKRVNMWSV